MSKIIKIGLVVSWFAVFGLFYFLPILNPFTYWWVFSSWAVLIWQFKTRNRVSFILSFILFLISAFIATINPGSLAENVMRISFIILIVGYLQTLIEFKHSLK